MKKTQEDEIIQYLGAVLEQLAEIRIVLEEIKEEIKEVKK